MKNKSDIPTQAEFGKLRAKLAIFGMTQKEITDAIGDVRLPRGEIAEKLIDWLRGND